MTAYERSEFMNAGTRDSYRSLLDDYAAIFRRRGVRVAELTSLRMRSLALRDVLAHIATHGRLVYDELRGADLQAVPLDPLWAATLGRVVGLQGIEDEDVDTAVRMLETAFTQLTGNARTTYARTLVEFLLSTGAVDRAVEVLRQEEDVRSYDHGYLWTDVLNPFRAGPYADQSAWETGFAARFDAAGLVAPRTDGNGETPFDRLVAEPPHRAGGALVSVVITTYRPDAALLTSVRSVANQTWQDLEILIVDDASPPSHASLLEAAASLDDRIRVIRLSENGGTYRARNVGSSAARGSIITGQDDDDWSHPERVERQVRPLLDDLGLWATRSRCLTTDADLVVSRPGYPATRSNASSLMFRKEAFDKLGGFLPVRRAADSEFHARIEVATGVKVLTLDEPLAVVRILRDSLSRSDFRAGWHHPARRAFRSAYERWHATSEASFAPLRVDRQLPFNPPRRFSITARPSPTLDVVLAGDWRKYGGPQKSMLEEIAALTGRGMRVGVLHVEAARFASAREGNLCAPVQDLINAGTVERVLDDEDCRSRLTILRYPPILQFPPTDPVALRSDRVVVLANQAPAERDGTDIRYDPRMCADNAEKLFGARALWVPQGPTVREPLARALPATDLASFDLPGILDANAWETERVSFRSDRPVIGRHSRDDAMKWPTGREQLTRLYPTDGSVEVRVMGGTSTPRKVLGFRPRHWVSFAKDEMPVRDFLNSLDFFVYYQNDAAYDAFGRAVLEALASGCVAVLPRHFEATFGDAAVYADPEQALRTVWRLYKDPARYRRQSRRAVRRVRERFSHASYVERVQALLASTDILSDFCAARPAG